MRSGLLPTKRCLFLSRATAGLLLSLLSLLALAGSSSASSAQPQGPVQAVPLVAALPTEYGQYHDFTLRHIFHHGIYHDPQLHKRLDMPQGGKEGLEGGTLSHLLPPAHIRARSQHINVRRLADRRLLTIESHLSQARKSGSAVSLAASAWTTDEIIGPNVTDKETILSLARASADAYKESPDDNQWRDVGGGFNLSQSFGWQQDGLRGHVFADKDNATILMALKGTSAAVFDGEGSTTNDKVNDNLFFSCCCGQGGRYFWRQVCDCYSTTFTCNQTCLVKALKKENGYYRAAIELYSNVTELYPQSNVWLTGHSLGGAVSSLLGMTFGIPTISYEAPGDALAAARLGLPAPPESDPNRPALRKDTGIYHFGHTADPVFMGTCNGVTDACTLGGYAMETQCHTGVQCVYDTVTDFGWSVGIANHEIENVIDTVLQEYKNLPTCKPDDECVDCFNWKYFESNSSDPATSTSTTTMTTRTRTATCQTPGWWGCLDKTTSTASSSSSSTTSTSTCKTPGWFWCNDPTTTTSSMSSLTAPVAPSITATTAFSTSAQLPISCHDSGWLGCWDPMSSTRQADQTVSCHHCSSPGLCGHCRDPQTTEFTTPITSAASLPSTTITAKSSSTSSTCTHKFFFGLVCLDSVSGNGSAKIHDTGRSTFSHGVNTDETDWRDEM